MTKIYQQAFTEVYEILSYLKEDDYNKIPKEVLNTLKDNMDNMYEFFVDTSISFYEQDILEETKAILFNLYRDYLADTNIKTKILEYQKEEQHVLEKIKQQNYDSKTLFFKNQKEKSDPISNLQAISLMETKSNNIFIKFIEKIKELLKKK